MSPRYVSFLFSLCLLLLSTSARAWEITVRNAMTHAPLSQVSCQMFGKGNVRRTTVMSTSTGECTFDDFNSRVTIKFEKAGYERYSKTLSYSTVTSTAIVVFLSQTTAVATRESRVVLSWKKEPLDLDSWLLGSPSEMSGNPSCRVNWNYKKCESSSTSAVAQLDIDYTDGFGPETTTLTSLSHGTYQFWVHIYPTTKSYCFDDFYGEDKGENTSNHT